MNDDKLWNDQAHSNPIFDYKRTFLKLSLGNQKYLGSFCSVFGSKNRAKNELNCLYLCAKLLQLHLHYAKKRRNSRK